MKLSVPYIPSKEYTIFLKNKSLNIDSVFFSLYSGPILDARMRFKTTDLYDLSKGLQQLKSIKKYCLLNSRFIHPDLYHDTKFLNQTLDKLEFLAVHSNINGIIFSDAYFLNAMAFTKRDILSCLEAVPGINMMIDSCEKAFSILEIIEQTPFKIPDKLVLDRSLNRNIAQLTTTAQKIKHQYNHVKIELLANEGCIYHCPFKLTHDSQISFSNLRLTRDKTFQTNTTFGCHTYFFKTPEKILKSPFIRPEDVDKYAEIADTIKLCGRTLGLNFLYTCILAYIEKSYDGNLLDLMDATHWLSDRFYLDNKKLGPEFFNQVTTCTKECKNCNICRGLFLDKTTPKPMAIKPYEDYL